eukprot:CAMPEP_0171481830 /NCGR_PEP_ID=MMETSP0946-20130122/7038_1 /TAXON_ID=109269 /ORGANISM="Vaucheria litorea, Strain CCMP2940" /LENGTH=309 /DNA_ID=CAMNT_0012013595 /DNA_START=3 /DNA_END=932 /DNA_ORIENTATION=+
MPIQDSEKRKFMDCIVSDMFAFLKHSLAESTEHTNLKGFMSWYLGLEDVAATDETLDLETEGRMLVMEDWKWAWEKAVEMVESGNATKTPLFDPYIEAERALNCLETSIPTSLMAQVINCLIELAKWMVNTLLNEPAYSEMDIIKDTLRKTEEMLDVKIGESGSGTCIAENEESHVMTSDILALDQAISALSKLEDIVDKSKELLFTWPNNPQFVGHLLLHRQSSIDDHKIGLSIFNNLTSPTNQSEQRCKAEVAADEEMHVGEERDFMRKPTAREFVVTSNLEANRNRLHAWIGEKKQRVALTKVQLC